MLPLLEQHKLEIVYCISAYAGLVSSQKHLHNNYTLTFLVKNKTKNLRRVIRKIRTAKLVVEAVLIFLFFLFAYSNQFKYTPDLFSENLFLNHGFFFFLFF